MNFKTSLVICLVVLVVAMESAPWNGKRQSGRRQSAKTQSVRTLRKVGRAGVKKLQVTGSGSGPVALPPTPGLAFGDKYALQNGEIVLKNPSAVGLSGEVENPADNSTLPSASRYTVLNGELVFLNETNQQEKPVVAVALSGEFQDQSYNGSTPLSLEGGNRWVVRVNAKGENVLYRFDHVPQELSTGLSGEEEKHQYVIALVDGLNQLMRSDRVPAGARIVYPEPVAAPGVQALSGEVEKPEEPKHVYVVALWNGQNELFRSDKLPLGAVVVFPADFVVPK